MALLLKNAHVVDPAANLDGVLDVLIDGDRISAVGEGLVFDGAEVIDLTGKYAFQSPASSICTCTFASPAFEHKGDISPRRLLRLRAASPASAPCPTPTPLPITAPLSPISKLAPPRPAIAAFTLRAP